MQKFFLITFVTFGLATAAHAAMTSERTVTIKIDHEAVIRQRVDEIKQSPRFQRFIDEEAERRAYEEQKADAEAKLRKIKGTPEHDQAKASDVLRAYLAGKNPALAKHADYIVALPRWVEAVAIISKETSYCRTGVGNSRNNCGGIKNVAGEFKTYASALDSIEDITILLQKPRYKSLTIQAMNGIYCQDEDQPGKRCVGWDTDIMRVVDELNGKLR